jgi:hypothetical protein
MYDNDYMFKAVHDMKVRELERKFMHQQECHESTALGPDCKESKPYLDGFKESIKNVKQS